MAATWKTVRVFISSTFRDMHAERDHLVKVVFPALRERLEKHRIHLVDIDLRWGVTAEQADNDRVLDLCLEQIDGSRPFFVGILGQRYGWVPHEMPDPAIVKFGWIQGLTGKSITELEILHGVLNNSAMHGHALFLFRQPDYLADVPCDIRRDVYEDEHGEQLTRIKERVRAYCAEHDAPLREYRCRWDATAGRLTDLERFGECVEQDLWAAIAREYPEITGETAAPAVPGTEDWLAEEEDYHERFVESRLRVYVGRQRIHKQLSDYLDGDSAEPLLLVGGSGTGKSAILGKQWQDWQQSHPDDFVLPHFVGASPSSTNLRLVLRRFCFALRKRFGLSGQEVPEELEKLPGAFRQLLNAVPDGQRAVFLIDAVNQFDEFGRAQDMHWVPLALPPDVKMIISCVDEPDRPQRALGALRARKIPEVAVEALTHRERFEIVGAIPSLSAKTLDPDQVDLLLDNPATRNPLYLIVALEELRGFGSFDKLNAKIRSLPRVEGEAGVTALFTQVIERVEEDFATEVVRTVLSLLASARCGLSEQELQELVGSLTCDAGGISGDGYRCPFPRVGNGPPVNKQAAAEELFPMLRQLRPYLLKRGDLVDFYHDGLRNAARNRYFSEEAHVRRDCHQTLARYFRAKGLASARMLTETVYHQCEGMLWEELECLLGDLHFIEAKCDAGMTYGLVKDYSDALDALPGQVEQRHRELNRQQRLHDYAERLVEYSRQCIEVSMPHQTHPRTKPLQFLDTIHLPAPPDSRAVRDKKNTEAEGQREAQGALRTARLIAFATFVSTHCDWLAAHPQETIPMARNYASGGPAVEQAESLVTRLTRLWVARDPRPSAPTGPPACVRIIRGHDGEVTCVKLSPDGTSAVSGGRDGTLRIWDAKSGEEKLLLAGHTAEITALDVTPDARLAISAGWDLRLRVWNLHAGELLTELPGHEFLGHKWKVSSVTIAADGSTAVTGGYDGTLRVWDVRFGQHHRTLTESNEGLHRVSSVALTPNGHTLVSASTDRLHVWDLRSGKLIRTLQGHTDDISSVAITPDGKLAILTGSNGSLHVWELDTGKGPFTVQAHNAGANCVAVTPDGKLAVSGGLDCTVRVWDLDRRQQLRSFSGHTSAVNSVDVSSDGKSVVSTSLDGIRLWDCTSDDAKEAHAGHNGAVYALELSRNGRLVVSASGDRTVQVWDVDSGRHWCRFEEHQGPVTAIAVSNDVSFAVSACHDQALRVWDLKRHRLSCTLEGHTEAVVSVAVTGDGKHAISASRDSSIRIWDLRSGRQLSILEGHTSGVNQIALSPDGQFIVSASNDRTVRLWDRFSAQLLRTLAGHTSGVLSIAFAGDGKILVSASRDQTLRIWDLNSGETLRTLVGHRSWVTHVTITHKGRYAISAGNDNTLRVWDLETGAPSCVLPANTDKGTRLTLPPGDRLAVATCGNSLQVWDLNSEKKVAAYFTSSVISAVSSVRDDQRFVCGTRDGQLHFLGLRNVPGVT